MKSVAGFTTEIGCGPLTGENYTELVRLSLPAGKYLIIGKGLVTNQLATSETVACNLYSSAAHLDTSDVTLPSASIIQASSYATLAFNAPVDLPNGGDVWIECIGGGEPPGIWASAFRLSALSVSSLIIQ